MNARILLAGFGGQGILFTGKFLAYCGMLADAQVSWLPSYGPEMRGGTANCGVVLSDEPVGSPLVTDPDILVAMNLPSLVKFESSVAAHGKVFVDSSLIDCKVGREDVEAYYVPATELADKSELAGLANMVMVGKVLRETGLFTDEQVESAMRKTVSERKAALLEANLRAIALGKAQA